MADVLITPASGIIEFKDGSNNVDGKIELLGTGNLQFTSPGGRLLFDDLQLTSTLYDINSSAGTSGQVLISTGIGISWSSSGSGSGLDADTLDGLDSTQFLRSDVDDSFTGTITGISDATNPVLIIDGNGPNIIRFLDQGSTTNALDLVYRTTSNTLGIEKSSNGDIFFTVDADTSSGSILLRGGNNNPDPVEVQRGSATADQVSLSFTASNRRWFGKGTDNNPYWSSTNNISAGDKIWHAGNDGAGSGLDADTLDGNDNTYFLNTSATGQSKSGSLQIGGAISRSTSGLTAGFTNNTTFAINTDVGDSVRTLSLVNESTTTNAMAVLGFRVNPNTANANAMLDIKFIQTGATNTSALHYTFNHGGTFADRFSILSSGNVGIGVTNPLEKLDVRGNVYIGGTDTGPNFIAFRGTTGDQPGNYNHTYIGERIYSPSTELSELFIFKGNDVPGAPGPDRIRMAAAEFRVDTYTSATGGASFETVATSANLNNRFIITSSGNIGIGITNPSNILHISGSAGTLLRIDGGSGGTGTRDIFISEFNTAAYGGIIRYDSIADLFTFGTVENSTVINAINVTRASGNVGVGLTNPGEKLDVFGNIRLGTNVSGATASPPYLSLGPNYTNTYLRANCKIRLYDNSGDIYGFGIGPAGDIQYHSVLSHAFYNNDVLTLLVTGSSTTIQGSLELNGTLLDINNQAGTAGQILSSTGTGVDWIDTSSIAVGNADLLDGLDSTAFLRSNANNDNASGTVRTSASYIEAGKGSGSVALTINDGYGNANIAFNHAGGVPDVTGSSGRIECAVDNATAEFSFELKNSTTAATAVGLTQVMSMVETGVSIPGTLGVTGTTTVSNVTLNGTLTAGQSGKIAFPDITAIPDVPTNEQYDYITFGANGSISQVSGRGALMITSSDDALILANGDVGRGFTNSNLSAGTEHIYLLSDSSIFFKTDLQEGFGTEYTWTLNDVGASIFPGTLYLGNQTTRYLSEPTGNFGSIQINGSGIGSWEGFSIDGRAVFMHDGSTTTGIYNDVDNEWLIRCIHNAQVQLYYNNSLELETTANGVLSSGEYSSSLTNSNQAFAGQHLTNAPFYNTFSQTGSQYQAIVKGRCTGSTTTDILSFGNLHYTNGDQSFCFHRIRSDGTNSVSYYLTGNSGTIWHTGNDGAGSGLDADTLDGIDSSDFFRGNDFNNTGNIRINNVSPTIGLIDTDHATASIHVNSNLFYILRNSAGNAGWATVDGVWPFVVNLLNNDITVGRTLYSNSYQNQYHFYSLWREDGVTALSNSYNFIMGATNDTGNKMVMFLNSSTRTTDGGANGLTFRNDGGPLTLGTTAQTTNFYAGNSSQILIQKNTPAISNGSYSVGNASMELRTTDASNPILGFHRSGYTASALYHSGYGVNSLRIRNADGNDGPIWWSGNDGSGSGLDADTLDGIDSASFLRSNTVDTWSVTSTVSDSTIYGVTFDHNLTGTTALTANRTKTGIYVDVDHTSTVGTTVSGQRETIFGTWSDVLTSGTPYDVYGLYGHSRSTNTTGTIVTLVGVRGYAEGDSDVGGTTTSVYGIQGDARDGGAGTVSSVYGGQFFVLKETAATATLATAIGTRSEVEIDGNTITNTYAAQHIIDIDGGTLTNAYLTYGAYEGTPQANNWSAYYPSAAPSYFANEVRIGSTTDLGSYALQVTGSAIVTSALELNGTLVDINNEAGTAGQILSSTGTGVDWIDTSSIAVGNADLLDNIDSSRFVFGDNATKTTYTGDFNAFLSSGFYNHNNATGAPAAATWYHLIANRHTNTGNNYQMQIAGEFFNSSNLFYRIIDNNTPSTWQRIWHSGNDGSGSGLDADTLDGIQSSSFVYDRGAGQVVTGTSWDVVEPGMYGVASASAFTGTNNPESSISNIYRYGVLSVFEANGAGIAQLYTPHTGNKIALRTGWSNGNWYGWQQVWTSLSDGAGSGLDADTVDGLNPTSANTGSTIVSRDASGNFNASNISLSGNLTVSTGNATGGGIILADDGDIVDLNTGYCAMRFSSGVQIYGGNRSGSAVITLGSNGNISCSSLSPNFTVLAQNAAAGEGGEFYLAKSNVGSLSGNIVFDINGNSLRIFEAASAFRGVFVDFTGCASQSALLHSSNYNSYAPTLTGGGASGTWGINITGNSATATTLQTARTIWGQSFNGSANVSGALSGATTITASSDISLGGELNFTTASNKYIDFYTDNDAGALSTVYLRLVNNGSTTFHSGITMTRGGAVTLYHNNSQKLETSSTGVSITGTATATTFSGSGASLTSLNASNLSSGTVPDARISGAYSGFTTINGFNIGGSSGNWYTNIATVASNGVLEIGRYIDFHSSSTTTSDYDGRLEVSGTDNFYFTGILRINTLSPNVTGGRRIISDGPLGIETSNNGLFLDTNGGNLNLQAGAGYLISTSTLNKTTTAAANMRINASGQFLTSSSSLRYKTNIEDVNISYSENIVYNSRPVWFRSTSIVDNPDWSWWGFIAEELDLIDKRLVDYDSDGNPNGVQYDRFTVHLVKVAQEQKKTIDNLNTILEEQSDLISDLQSRLTSLEQIINNSN